MSSGTGSIGTGREGALPDERPGEPRVCPSAETVAAYLDGALDAAGRWDVERHAAACADCREVLAESWLALASDEHAAAPVRGVAPIGSAGRATGRGAGWVWPTIGALAAAAVLVIAVVTWRVGRPDDAGPRPELEALVAAVGEQRLFESRLTGGFRFGPLAPVMRSGERQDSASPDVRIAAARLELAAEQQPSSETRAAAASAALVLGRPEEAIRLLQQVVREAPDRASAWSDLAAAWLVRHDRHADSSAAEQALAAADRALVLVPKLPEALFNRALALERLGRRDDADQAWQAAAAAEPDPRWSEGRGQRAP